MKSLKLISLILVIFLKTGNVLSEKDLFSVNNIEINFKSQISNTTMADMAIKKGFEDLINRVLLKEDITKFDNLNLDEIKKLISYYRIVNNKNNASSTVRTFNISFDKDKLHDLFYKKGISYSDLEKKEFYLLPILKRKDQIYIYTGNYFYENWNKKEKDELIEFVLPLENIETIQKINLLKNNLIDLDLREIFQEYSNKNLGIILIEEDKILKEKIFLKVNIMGKNIIKTIRLNKSNLKKGDELYDQIILDIKSELINLSKSQNLIDIRTPSFINAMLKIDKKNNLIELNKRLSSIDLIESIYVQEFNNNNVFLKIKYLGRIDKIIKELKKEKIILQLKNNQWRLKII